MTTITVFKARRIITMNRRQPITEFVAVRDGLILGTGTLDSLQGWGDYTLDETFADKTLLPGFIEGHCHSWEGAAWEDTFVGFLDRTSPSREVHTGLKNIDAVIKKLSETERALPADNSPVKSWGLDPIFFERRVTCKDLDRVSTTRPVVVVHQSGHSINVNSYVLEKANITRDTDVDGLVKDPNGNPTGELMGIALYQTALKAVGMGSILDMGQDPEAGLWRFAHSARIAGVTTLTDLASSLDPVLIDAQHKLSLREDYPVRVVTAFMGQMFSRDEALQRLEQLQPKQNPKLRIGLVKIIIDGSIQGFTARFKAPGYFNGAPNGLWYVDPDDLPSIIESFHQSGHQIHIHTNGDEATELAIDTIESVLQKHPAADARFTLQHCQMAHDAHYRRMSKLGICANLFANHIYYWGDQHYAITMGPERACRMDAAATAKSLGVDIAIHSDAPVTHLAPLFTAWCAVNRLTYTGRILGEQERISVTDALYAITLGAAYTLKMDHEIGSIETGKRADFTVLEQDPLEVDPAALKDIPVWGTVLDGRPFPISDID